MIILVGESASGKTEAALCLRREYGICKAITHTTRQMRQGERQDVDYHFVTREQFLKKKEQGGFVETTEYNGNLYGCSKQEVAEGKCVVVDPNGLDNFKALKDPGVVTFHLKASEAKRIERMRKRGDSEKAIESRIENDRECFEGVSERTDFELDTDGLTIEQVAAKVYSLYKEELSRRKLKI